jgi:hypothetical protein
MAEDYDNQYDYNYESEDEDYGLEDMMGEMENKEDKGDYEYESDGEEDLEGAGYLLGGARRVHHKGYKGLRHCVSESVGPHGKKRCHKYARGGVMSGGYRTGGYGDRAGARKNPWLAFLAQYRRVHPQTRHMPQSEVAKMASKAYRSRGGGVLTGGARRPKGHKRGMKKGEHCLSYKVGPSGRKRCGHYGMGFNYPLGIYD